MKKILFAAAIVMAPVVALAQSSTTTTTTITTEQQSKVRAYVMKEKPASMKVTETVAVGTALPASVTLQTLPADVGVTQYRYAVVNDKTVLVEPSSRKIIQVIE
jgi:methionine-rich copper-binding protein CopC